MRLVMLAIVIGCSGPARQPAPQPQPAPQGQYVEFGVVVDEPAGPPGSRTDDLREDPPGDKLPGPAARPVGPVAPGTLVVSGDVKVYRGPERARIITLEVNDGKQMLLHFQHVDRELDGRTLLYDVESLAYGRTDVYVTKKRGSKTFRSTIMTARDHHWQFFHPLKHDVQFHVGYSEWESKKLEPDDVLKTYNP